MRNRLSFILWLVIYILSANSPVRAQISGFNKIKWEREKIAPGLIWKSSLTILNDSVPQNINILIVSLRKRRIAISYNPRKNIPVSIQASEAGGIAAVNAGFFNIKTGGSTTYIKTGGEIVDSDTAKKWIPNSNMNGAILIRLSADMFIGRAVPNNWFDSHPEYEDVLVTGPLLMEKGTKIKLPETSLVTNRHPRTVAGTRNSKKIVLVTVDGRSEFAAGMTLYELSELMKLLKCNDAINLDGGGSTTMWINGKPFNGVVNMPSDNKRFDHEGERAVSDILVIR